MQNNSPNQTLRAVLAQRQGKGFSEVEATNILRQLLPQIDYSHQQNQAHGQISLDTIIQNNQHIILTATPTPQPANQINIQQDIYALGVVIIELLTGKVANSLRNADGSWNWEDDCFVSDQFADVINGMIGNSAQGKFNFVSEIIAALGLSTPVNQVVNSQGKNKIAPWKFGLMGVGSTVLVGLAGFGVWNLVSPMLSSSNPIALDKKQQHDGLFPIPQDGKWGYIDKNGKVVIQHQFDYAGIFQDGLAPVVNKTTKKFGFIDNTGKLVIEQKFDVTAFTDSAGLPIFFDNGMARIKIDEKWGYINKTGNIVIKPQFDYVDSRFSDNLALIQIGDKRGYIDKQGQIVINPQFEDAYGFSEGFASVKIGNKWGFIDKQGQVVISPQFDYVMPFSEGMSCVQIDGKWGFIDKSGKLVISPQFENAFSVDLGITAYLFGIWGFSEGLHPIEINNQWGFIDKTGNYVISPQFDEANFFTEGLAAVRIDKQWGYINKEGKFIINPQFENALSFQEGIATVVINDGKMGYINKKGEYIWQPTNVPSQNNSKNIDTQKVTSTPIETVNTNITKADAPDSKKLNINESNSFYFISDEAFVTNSKAAEYAESLKKLGYTQAGVFWIPDYPNLSGKRLFIVYPARFNDRESCKKFLKQYARNKPEAYCVLASKDKSASPDRFYSR